MRILKKMFAAAVVSVAVAGALPCVASAADIGFSLTENEATNTLTSSLAGTTITTLGPDHWSINFAGSAVTSFTGAGTNMTWAEQPGDPGVNWFHFVSGTTFELNSDWTGATGAGNCGGTAPPLAQGVTCLMGTGGGNGYFVTVVETAAAPVPEPATLLLLGSGLVAFGGLTTWRRVRSK